MSTPESLEEVKGLAPHLKPVRLPEAVKAAIRKSSRRARRSRVKSAAEVEGARWIVQLADGSLWRVSKEKDGGYAAEKGDLRHYKASELPLVQQDVQTDKGVHLDIYKQVGDSWRMLTDVRFKLLALVPAVSIVAWSQLLRAATLHSFPGSLLGLGISVVGLALVGALCVYDRRNDELYDDLVSRGRRIEAELGIDTGVFHGRRRPKSRWIRHGVAVTAVYGLSAIGWIGVLGWFVLVAAGQIPDSASSG